MYMVLPITSGAARLRGTRCQFSDNRAAGELDYSAAVIREALERIGRATSVGGKSAGPLRPEQTEAANAKVTILRREP